MADWGEWIGREQRAVDRLDPASAARWHATFDRGAPASAAMPPGIHFCLCTPEAPTAQLGPDGHPLREDQPASFLPPIPLPRRMWASSAIRFRRPIAVGASIERVSRVVSITPKSGNRGDMVFVEIDHETSADGEPAVSERQ
ncbi:MAG: MaoC family dehydratase N-terminal domain-containing protein, partial [Pseudomonadota bacterium]|nr:MaoC family dehydratase N-terminal domain-containing protein [Pseudomonadota bacterium]